MRRKGSRGFTLMELLVVVAIIGILAMIAIVNYWLGLQRAKQKRTMTDIRSIASAWEARAADIRGYNASGWTVPGNSLTPPELDSLLVPTYLKSVPHLDAWVHPYEYLLDAPIGGNPANEYAIRSAGSDKTFDGADYTQGTTTKFECDIVYSNGAFISYPEAK